MDDPNRDTAVSIDVQFGCIKFLRRNTVTVACVTVEVVFPSRDTVDDTIAMEVEFLADPETETILAIVETARMKAIDRLQSIAKQLEAKSATMLLFGHTESN